MGTVSRSAVPRSMDRRLYQEVGHQCPICDTSDISSLSIHHIISYAQVKDHQFEAMIVLCNNCHGRADRNELTVDELFAKKRELSTIRSQAKKPSVTQRTVVGVVAAGGDIHVEGGIFINQTKRKEELSVRPGSVAEDVWMVGYLDHLVKRFNEFKNIQMNRAGMNMNHALIRVNYEKEIGFPLRHTPIGKFSDAVAYLQARINGTVMGKASKKKGIPNFSEFVEWKKKKGGDTSRSIEELADAIILFARPTAEKHPNVIFSDSVLCTELNEEINRVTKALDDLVARGRAKHAGLPGKWRILV